MKKINALINHLIKGTLINRMGEWKKHRLFRKYEAFVKSDRDYIEKTISSKITIRLFKKANLSRELYCYGFEEKEIIFLKNYVKHGDLVLDIGANIGLFTLICSEYVGSNGKVYAFEPSPETFGWLEQNAKANQLSNVSLNQLAVSDRDGTIDFYLSSEGFDAFNSIVKPSKGSNYVIQTVNCMTLDSFVEKHDLKNKMQIIKIDVEGFEISLLNGAIKTLSAINAPDLVVEFTESNAVNAGFSCAQLYDKITSLGYKLFQYDVLANRLIPEPKGMSYVRYKNLIATKDPEMVNKKLSR